MPFAATFAAIRQPSPWYQKYWIAWTPEEAPGEGTHWYKPGQGGMNQTRLITRRSRVQIPPPLRTKTQAVLGFSASWALTVTFRRPNQRRCMYSAAAWGSMTASCAAMNSSLALARGWVKPAPTTTSPGPHIT